MNTDTIYKYPDVNGKYGIFGGRFVPEILMGALDELQEAYYNLRNDDNFKSEYEYLQKEYNGRPTPLTYADRLTSYYGRGKIYLKREDLNHTGAHKINNTIGQILLAKKLGKKRIIAETGAGQHGVATATVCAKFGMKCQVYMGAEDVERQKLNVYRMQLLGAEVIPVESGTKTLKDAANEAIRDWVTNIGTTHYIIGSVIGPHPYPEMVRDFQSVIGNETEEQVNKKEGKDPDYVVASVGGGSNAIGIFHPFIGRKNVKLIGVEAAGLGLHSDKNCATLTLGRQGIFHGSRMMLLQDDNGQILPVHSISAGLDYPGVGPEHAYLKDAALADYFSITDEEALEAVSLLSKTEGIIPALESAHAIAYLNYLTPKTSEEDVIVINLSGRGDKDMHTIMNSYSGEEQ